MKRVLVLLGVLAFMLAAAGVSYAVSLSTLLDPQNPGSIQVGDKLFDNWALIDYTASDGRTFNAANIDVTGLSGGLNPGPGLSFTVLNHELNVTGDGTFAFVDLWFGFKVSVLDPNYMIKDNVLSLGNAALSWTGDGTNDLGMYIQETVGTAMGLDDLGLKKVEFSILNNVETFNVTDSAVFSPQSQIWVTKNIIVWAADTTDTASLQSFNQYFSQVPVGVPEPGILLLFASGIVTLLAGRKMFKQHKG